MEAYKIIIVSVYILSAIYTSAADVLSTKEVFLARKRRAIIWKEGINWVQLVVGIGLPVQIEHHSVTLGPVLKAYYLLPTNSSDFTHPSYNIVRKKRSPSRWNVYELVEYFIRSFGYGDGKACLLREICEMTSNPLELRLGILSEILQVLLTPSSTQEVPDNHLSSEYLTAEKLGKDGANCSLLFPECNSSFMEQFTKTGLM